MEHPITRLARAFRGWLSSIGAAVRQSFRSRPDLLYLFTFALLIRLLYLGMMFSQVSSEQILSLVPDTVSYVRLGQDMMHFRIVDESTALVFGPGYAAFLGGLFALFGVTPMVVLLVQVILSSLSCVLIARLGEDLTGSRGVGLIAGILSATSFTSISLATIILSDSLFVFLFLLGNVLFLEGMDGPSWRRPAVSGLCIGLSILTRTAGQLWPLAMILIILVLPSPRWIKMPWKTRVKFRRRSFIAPLVALVLVSFWIARNYYYDSVAILSVAGSHGFGKVTVFTQARVEGRDYNKILVEWVADYKKDSGRNDLGVIDYHHIYMREFRKVVASHPFEMLRTFGLLIWDNLIAVNELYNAQVPKSAAHITSWLNWLRHRSLHILPVILNLAGLAALIVSRRWRTLVVAGAIYIYFVMMAGFGSWQGSRLFYPGQIAWTIVIAFLLVGAAGLLRRGFGRIFRRVPWIGRGIVL